MGSHFYDDCILSLGNKCKLLPKQNKKKGKAKGDLPKDLPRWITGNLADTDQDDYFISEDESERRIFIAVQIFITFLLIACCVLVEKCFNNSNFSVERRRIHASNGE